MEKEACRGLKLKKEDSGPPKEDLVAFISKNRIQTKKMRI